MAPSISPSLKEVAAATACFVSHPEPMLDDAKKIITMLDEFHQRNIDHMELALCKRQKAISEEGQKGEALEAKVVSMKQDILSLAGHSAEVPRPQDYVGKTDEPQERPSIVVLTREFQPEADHNGRDRLRRKEHLGQGGKGDQVPHTSVIGSGA